MNTTEATSSSADTTAQSISAYTKNPYLRPTTNAEVMTITHVVAATAPDAAVFATTRPSTRPWRRPR